MKTKNKKTTDFHTLTEKQLLDIRGGNFSKYWNEFFRNLLGHKNP